MRTEAFVVTLVLVVTSSNALLPRNINSRKVIAPRQYEPSPMEPQQLLSQLAVFGTVSAAAGYWWYELVPAKRSELAKAKRDKSEGSLGGYLEELRADEKNTTDRRFEKWLLSDWLDEKRNAKKAAAIPFLGKVRNHIMVLLCFSHFYRLCP